MKSLQLTVTKLGLFTASCAFMLTTLSACVKTSSPSADFDPQSLLPKMTDAAGGAGSAAAPGAGGSAPGPAKPDSACPPSLKTDYNNAMNECMSNPSGSNCLDLQKQFLAKYPNANCSFKDDDGNVNTIKVENGRINVSVASGDSSGGDGAATSATPTPVVTTPAVPSSPSLLQCTQSQLLAYDIYADCMRLHIETSTLGTFASCKTTLSSHVESDPQFKCSVPPSESDSGAYETFSSQDLSTALDRVSEEYDELSEQNNSAPATPVTPPADDSANNDEEPLPVCSTKVIARFALYKKNTAICRVSDTKLAAHRKACVGLATAMLKAEPNVDCQVPARGSQGFEAGTELRTSDVQDDQSDFQ